MFQLEVSPTADDIDELDHVSNVVYLRWVQDVARAHSDAVGWTFDDYQRAGAVFVVKRHELEYRRPALLGDRLVLETWVSEWRGASSWRETRILRGDTELVRGRTRWAFIDAETGRPRRIPDDLAACFTSSPSTPRSS
jgi:acyl-CoA thioester hydrolase